MTIGYILIVIILIIAILYLVQRFVSDPDARKMITIAVAIGAVIFILYAFGLWDLMSTRLHK